MKAFTGFLSGWATIVVMVFVALFDTDGVALGTVIFPEVSDGWVGLANIVGNLVWLFGAVFWFAATVIFVIFVGMSNKEKIVESAQAILKKKPLDPVKHITHTPIQWATIIVSFSTSIFMIGSGFWWTGSGWLAIHVSVMMLNSKLKAATKALAEADETTEAK